MNGQQHNRTSCTRTLKGMNLPLDCAPSGEPSKHSIDRIPFLPEQLKPGAKVLERIVEMEDNKLISLEFTSLEALRYSYQHGNEKSDILYISLNGGPETDKLIPYLLCYLNNNKRWSIPGVRSDFSINKTKVGGSMILVGQSDIPISLLDSIATSEIILMPFINSNEPNGIWSIRRGENHPIVLSSKGVIGYFLTYRGQPYYFFSDHSDNVNVNNLSSSCAFGLGLFKTKQKATKFIESYMKDDETVVGVIEFRGYDLFQMLSYLDIASIDGEEYALTCQGMRAFELETLVSYADIAAFFKQTIS
mgnify:CR=1 FL=1